MIDSILQKLLAADDVAEKAAIVAESVFEKLPEDIGIVSRLCVILHWFDQMLLEALLKDVPLVRGKSTEIYQHIVSLPFIESLAWGAAFQNLTREGLLKHFALSQPELLVTAAKLAAPAYITRGEYGMFAAEAFFCHIVAGESKAAIELLDNLFEEAIRREDWSYIYGLMQLQEEAEQLPFVHPLSLSEKHWIVRGLAQRVQGELESAIVTYQNAIAINPNNALTHNILGTIYAEQSHDERALDEYDRALRLDDTLVQLYINRGIIHFRHKHFNKAMEDFDQALRLDPSNREAYIFYMQCFQSIAVPRPEQWLAVFEHMNEVGFRLLSEPARQLLPYLAVFTLPFSDEQIVMLVEPKTPSTSRALVRLENEHTLKGSSSEEEELLRTSGSILSAELQKNWRSARDELVQTSFVQFDGRLYNIHAQVRHFAHTLLPSEEYRRIHRVVAAYYSSLPHPSAEQWFAAFEHLEEADEPQDLQKAIYLAVAAARILHNKDYASELQAILERAQNHALLLGDKTGEGKIQCCLGAILRQQGKYAQAVGCLTRSLALHREQNEPDEAGWALYELAMLLREEGHFKQAGEYAQEALELFREARDMSGVAWMQMVLGEVSRGYGRYQEAQEQLEEVLTSFHALNNEEGYAHALFDRSTIYEALGLYSEALADSEEALRLFTKLGLRFWQAWVLSEQSAVFLDQGKYDQAERTCSESIAIFREQKALRGEGWALRVLGDIARKRRNTIDARDYYHQSLALFTRVGDRVDQARVLNSLGANSLAEGHILEAKERFEHARALAHEQKALQLEGRALRGLGDVARVQQQFAEAERFYSEAATIAANLGTPAERCAILHRQGELYQIQGKYREALAAWFQGYIQDRRVEHPVREALKERIDSLVAEHELQAAYAELCEQYGF